MMRYVALAVDGVLNLARQNLAAELAAVEAENSLAAGSLRRPEYFTRSRQALFNQTPQVQVYHTAFRWESQKCRILIVTVQVALAWTGKACLDDNEDLVRHWLTAWLDMMAKNPNLDGQPGIIQGLVTAGTSASTLGDDSAIRHIELMDLDVKIHTPEA